MGSGILIIAAVEILSGPFWFCPENVYRNKGTTHKFTI